jgi:hypothetical protein
MNAIAKDRMHKFEIAMTELNLTPEIIFARRVDSVPQILMMMAAPVLTEQHLDEMQILIDEKRKRLRNGH